MRIAEAGVSKEAIMRRRDFRGEKECRGAVWERRVRMVSRWVGWKMLGSRRFCLGGRGGLVGEEVGGGVEGGWRAYCDEEGV